MSWVFDISRLISFLLRWAAGLKGLRFMLWGFLATGVISGLCNVAFLVLINRILGLGGAYGPVEVWTFIGLCVMMPLSRFVSGLLLLRLTARASYDLRTRLARRILATSLRQLERLGAHRLVAMLSDDVPSISNALFTVPNFVMQLFIVLGCLVYLGLLSWPLLLLVVGFMVAGIFSYQIPIRAAAGYLEHVRRAWDSLSKGVEAITRGIKELQLHGERRSAFLAKSFDPAAAEMEHNSVRGRGLLLLATSWGHALSFVALGLVLFGIPGLPRLDVHVLTGYALVIMYMTAPLAGIMESLPILTSASVAVQAVEGLHLALEPEASLVRAPASLPVAAGALELAGVTHTYEVEGEERAFHVGPLHLSVAAGDLLFVTGGNGSGKTTLAKLLCGLYRPETGEVRLGGEAVTDGTSEAFRQSFAVVFSDCFVFDTLYGMGEENLDRRAKGYLERLRLDRVVAVRDGALSTVNVSQGQRKRLALLTAYLEDRPFYLFDEWAADQDPIFKEVFYRQILPELKERGKTVIVISHDDRYYAAADRVIKLEDGQIVAHDRRIAGAA